MLIFSSSSFKVKAFFCSPVAKEFKDDDLTSYKFRTECSFCFLLFLLLLLLLLWCGFFLFFFGFVVVVVVAFCMTHRERYRDV